MEPLPIFFAAATLPSARSAPRLPLRSADGRDDRVNDRLHVRPVDFHPVGIGRGQVPLLEGLHRPGDGHAAGDRIDPVVVADAVYLDGGGQIRRVQQRSECRDRLVLGPRSLGGLPGSLLDLGHALAGDRAECAGPALGKVVVGQLGAGQRGSHLLVVVRGEVLDRDVPVDHPAFEVGGGAVLVEHDGGQRLLQGGVDLLSELLVGGRVGERHLLFGCLDHDPLEVFRAHHGPETGAAEGVVGLVHDIGELDELFSGRADEKGPGVLSVLGLQLGVDRFNPFPPVRRRRPRA